MVDLSKFTFNKKILSKVDFVAKFCHFFNSLFIWQKIIKCQLFLLIRIN